MWYVRDVLYAVLYVRVSCFVVRGCGVSRRYIDVCYCDMFSVVNVYLDHLKFCVLIVEGMSVVVNVMLSLMSVMSPPPALCNLSVRTAVKLCILGVLALGVNLVGSSHSLEMSTSPRLPRLNYGIQKSICGHK